MSALWIAHVRVTDAEAYGRYASMAGPVIAAHGGVFLARGGRYRQLEGNDRSRNVVARFPSLDAAVACYESREYQAALAHAKGASERDLVIVEEAPPAVE
ncbi:DUF1330 domain-containing protein [Paracoccus salsus]|uniref:DUF1330 domain-containing protein n=1 Tax=Paracoccus salsus TaxID=2911061 RepID=UPI001F247EB7|nr:DUF1330 domain-containing protein [Paracoccus salsus]MCF3974017.1 DUF1330 domain-containing protein [Paracoccus salsus]